MSNQLVLDLPLVSVKYHQDEKNAYSGLFGVDSSDSQSSYAMGFRYFRNIFKEKNINFYNSLGLSLFSYTQNDKDKSGYQLDWCFGSEFAFEGLSSLGLSFEFGLSALDYLGEKSIRTNANNFIKSAIHFYL